MLALTGRDWEPVFVDYFGGETRTERFRREVNAMGEIPVLEHGGRRLSQSGVILDYLASETGRFGPSDDEERRAILGWILFDNHKFTSYYATLRYLVGLTHSGDSTVVEFLRARVVGAFGIVDAHLGEREFLLGNEPTIADLSLVGYLYYREETGVDLDDFPRLVAWTERVASLPGWKHPYELMPRGLQA
jgi:glutathione S-transferase